MATLTSVVLVLTKDNDNPATIRVDVQAAVATGVFKHTLADFALTAPQQAAVEALMTTIRAAVKEHVRAALVLV